MTKAKRSLFEEIKSGFVALKAEREGSVSLNRVTAKQAKPLSVNATQIAAIRHSLELSRAEFAYCLHVPARTIENWEQGRTKPDAAAATLLTLVREHPETLHHLKSLQD